MKWPHSSKTSYGMATSQQNVLWNGHIPAKHLMERPHPNSMKAKTQTNQINNKVITQKRLRIFFYNRRQTWLCILIFLLNASQHCFRIITNFTHTSKHNLTKEDAQIGLNSQTNEEQVFLNCLQSSNINNIIKLSQ